MLNVKDNAVTGTVALEMLALEAENSNNILQSAVSLIPNVMVELTTSMNGLVELGKAFSFSELKSKVHANFFGAKDVPEDTLSKVFVPTPEGFIGNVDKYQASLAFSVDYYEEVTSVLLREFYVTVAAFVTNKDRKLSIKDDTAKFKGYEATRTGLTKDISSHFSKGNTGRTLFHDAYGSYGEFKKVCKDNNSLTKRLDQIDLKKVADQVKKIVDTLDIAIASAERGDYDKASNEALMNMANGTFELAQQVEFFAATAYRIKALTFAIGETEDKIKSL